MDAFASAFGFFLIGFDGIARYSSAESANAHFFKVSDPLLWFFKVSLRRKNCRTFIINAHLFTGYSLHLPVTLPQLLAVAW